IAELNFRRNVRRWRAVYYENGRTPVSRTIVECVPNFSEGRDRSKLDAIAAAIRSVPGVTVLDLQMDADHNRSVVTFAAPAQTIGEAAVRGIEQAVALIDMNRHRGVHPRIGAA